MLQIIHHERQLNMEEEHLESDSRHRRAAHYNFQCSAQSAAGKAARHRATNSSNPQLMQGLTA